VGYEHTDGVFDLFRSGSHQGSVGADSGDSSVNDMVDFVSLEGENFAKSSSDFVLQNHSFQSHLSINIFILMGSSDNCGIEIIMSKFSSCVSWNVSVISENGTIAVPFSNSRGIGEDCLFDWNLFFRTDASGVTVFGFSV